MSNNLKILLVGASQMAVDYYKVLSSMQCSVTVIGRSHSGVAKFNELTNYKAITGGLDKYCNENEISHFNSCIVSVGLEELFNTTALLIAKGAKHILVEKPAGLTFTDIEDLNGLAKKNNAEIFVAYNRRFFESVIQTQKIINDDGGIKSFHFEFTEWSHVIEGIEKRAGIKENWFMANSSHVIDLAFFLGGEPKQMSSFVSGNLSWHSVSTFVGSGITSKGALFTYNSNWEAPGRWCAEFLTSNYRIILKPLEEIQIQKKGSVLVERMAIDTEFDKTYKPGLYKQVEAFIKNDTTNLLSLQNHTNRLPYLKNMLEGNK